MELMAARVLGVVSCLFLAAGCTTTPESRAEVESGGRTAEIEVGAAVPRRAGEDVEQPGGVDDPIAVPWPSGVIGHLADGPSRAAYGWQRCGYGDGFGEGGTWSAGAVDPEAGVGLSVTSAPARR